jgi:oligopeptide transport system substrate-binding protein
MIRSPTCHSERSEESGIMPAIARRSGFFTALRMTGFAGGFFCAFWCLFVAIQTGCSKPAAPAPLPVLRIGQRNEPATLDPHLATLADEFFIIRALSEGLLTPAPGGGAPLPAVAESWQVAPDGRTYTFQLRADARWSNGDPVTASDFVFSIRRALSPALAAPKATLFFPLKNARAIQAGREKDYSAVGARALADRRLELTLEEPTADFLAMVASGPWIPVHRATIEKFGRMDQRDTAWTRPGNFVGNGPFTLSTWRLNQDISVEHNAKYHDAVRVHLSGIRFVAFDNSDTEERAFRAGQVDVTMAVPFSKLASYRAAQPPVLHNVPLHETRYLALNTTRPPLDDRRVRRALALAVNRAVLVEKVMQGGQQPALGFIPPGLGGYTPAAQFAEDAAESRRLLREAGFPDGRGFPKLELTTFVNTPVLEAIQQMWRRELGVEVTLAQREARTHLAALAAGDYALALVPAIPDYDGASDLFTQLQSGNPANYPHWSNPEFDRLVAEAGRTESPVQRNGVYQQAEKVLLDEMPLIPLYFNAQNFLLQPRVKNWQTDRLWTRFYKDIFLE